MNFNIQNIQMKDLPLVGPLYQFLGPDVFVAVVGLLLILGFVQINALALIWVERKVAGHIQLRPGPMEVGPHGLLQTLADGIKLMGKEMITPQLADKPLYWLAPIIIFIPALVGFVIIPFSPLLQVRDLNVGILLIFSFSSLSVLSILMGGWASNNKYALIGAARSVAQIIAYEIPLLLSTMSVVIMCNSFKMSEIIAAQKSALVYRLPAHRGRHLSDRRHGRDQPGTLRPARGRIGAGGRVSYRVYGYAFRPLFPGRVQQHVHHRGHGRHPLLRGLAGTAAASVWSGL